MNDHNSGSIANLQRFVYW